MTPYQVLIEGVFVDVGSVDYAACGFHTTFYLMANNASNAVHRVGPMLESRMAVHGVSTRAHGVFETYFLVRDIWQVTDEKLEQNAGKDLGFSFFTAGKLEKVYLMLRHVFLRRFKPWLLIKPAYSG